MVRVIRTEYYPSHFSDLYRPQALSIAWIHNREFSIYGDEAPSYSEASSLLEVTRKVELVELGDVYQTTTSFLNFLFSGGWRDNELRSFAYDRSPPVGNESLDLLDLNVIIEQSPPDSVDLYSLLGKATAFSIGTFMGTQTTFGHPVLLFVTIPTGIIIVGAAKGLSQGLEKGLATWVTKRLNPTAPRSPRTPRQT